MAAIAGAVFAGGAFGEVYLGHAGEAWAPSFRVTLRRSLDVDKSSAAGSATFRFTQVAVETCPLRAAISSSLAMRPCAGASGGTLEAQGQGVMQPTGSTRPWVSAFAHLRLAWRIDPALVVALDLGALVPFFRESFSFDPDGMTVYQAPWAALVTRLGAGVLFP